MQVNQKPTAEVALEHVESLFSEVKATKAEHQYLDECLKLLKECVSAGKSIVIERQHAAEVAANA